MIDHFTDAPFGWSQDTLRYLIAAMLIAGEIKLKVSGRDVTVNGQQAIDALRTNNSFKVTGVALRDDRPSNESPGPGGYANDRTDWRHGYSPGR